jgi:hypothetical protein
MKVLSTIVCFAVVLVGVILLAADQPSDFSGKWIPDLKKSDLKAKSIMAPGNSGVSDPSRGGGMGGGGPMPGGGGPMMGGGGPMMGGGGPMPGGGGFGGPQGKQQAPSTLPPLTIEQTPTTMKLSTVMVFNGTEGPPLVENFALDRKEDLVEKVPNMFTKQEEKKRTKISLKKNKFQVRAITEGQRGNTETKRTFELSNDGKTLTMEMLNDMGFSQTLQKIVYNKE